LLVREGLSALVVNYTRSARACEPSVSEYETGVNPFSYATICLLCGVYTEVRGDSLPAANAVEAQTRFELHPIVQVALSTLCVFNANDAHMPLEVFQRSHHLIHNSVCGRPSRRHYGSIFELFWSGLPRFRGLADMLSALGGKFAGNPHRASQKATWQDMGTFPHAICKNVSADD
jgi:hypothetical protein